MTVEQAVTTTSATKPVSTLAQKVTAGAALAIALLIVFWRLSHWGHGLRRGGGR
ncbi:hypothetical protein GFS60_08155 (plasmid) [Rhodococcus sp. WAY2]|nr:hypothetical protein GFS60_08155 [Rhodococcus sp. WAY2]